MKRAYILFLLFVLSVVVGSACGFDPNINDGAFACAADKTCPDGFSCAANNRCYRPGAGPADVVDAGGGNDAEAPFVPPSIQADPISIKEGDTGTTDFVFNVRIFPAVTRQVSVDYATVDGTAKTPEDYAAVTGTLVFAPGTTSQQVTVKVIGDRYQEPDDVFTLKLSNPVNGTLAITDVNATILNDDGPGVSVDDVTTTEGDVDTSVDLTIILSGTYANEVTLSYGTLDGTAKAGLDYIATTGSLTFLPGERAKVISIPIKGDLAHEPEKLFIFNLSNVIGAPVIKGTALVHLIDNDPVPTLSVADASLPEGNSGNGNLTFTVTLSAASSEDVRVNYATSNGTATTADYSSTSGTLIFPAGTTTQTISVSVNGDTIDEPDQTFTVTLSMPTNAVLSKATATGTIIDDDAAPKVTVADVALAEGDSATKNFSFVFTLADQSEKTITIAYATADVTATAGTDYVAKSGTVTFAPGETTKTVDVLVNGDLTAEPTETFKLNVNTPSNVLFACDPCTSTFATGKIINDDGAAAKFSIDDPVAVGEGDSGTQTITFTVTCVGTITTTVPIDYQTADVTATAGADYVATTGTLNFTSTDCSAGGKTQTIQVTVNGDTIFEGGTGTSETFTMNLSTNSADGAIIDSQGIGTINDDDAKPTVAIVANVGAPEGNQGTTTPFSFDVTLSNAAKTNVTVDYTTGGGTATGGTDYVTTSGTLTFAPGEISKTITVTVNGDNVYEQNETFLVTLSNNTANSTLGNAVGTGTIENDETRPTISIDDVSHNEGNTGTTDYVFTVTLSGQSSENISVDFTTADGTATVANGDYAMKSGTLMFAPGGALTQTITVVVNGDTTFEPTETFNVNLSNAVNTSFTDSSGLGTIVNDETRLFSISDASAQEGNSLVFTVTLNPASSGTTKVDWNLVDINTTTADHQSSPLSGTLTFNNNDTTKTITITTFNDTLDELDETLEIHLSNVQGSASIGDGVGVGTILDNDTPPSVSLSGPSSDGEGTSGSYPNFGINNQTFTVTLSKISGRQVTVQYATQDGTAQSTGGSKADYNGVSGTLTFDPGQTTKTFTVGVVEDGTDELNENFTVVISNPDGATLGTSTKTFTIFDDDP